MKIGIDARFVGPQGTGLGKYTEKLILNLAEIDKNNQYFIFLKEDNWLYLKLNRHGNFTKVLADVPWYSFAEQLKMPAIFAARNLDLLHVPHFNVPIFYKGKFAVTIHDLIHHKFTEYATTTKNPLVFKLKRLGYKKIIENAVYKSQKIITPSNFVKNDILKNFKVQSPKIVVTYEAAEEEYFNRQPPTARLASRAKRVNRQPFLLYVGNAYPHKNLGRLLDAFKILVHSSQFTVHSKKESVNHEPTTYNLKLIIVCPRDVFSERLRDEIAKRDLQKNVEVEGYMEPQELSKLFHMASAYVFPSLSEGFGIPGLNAMASDIPVLSSNIPVLKEVYGDAAIYFNPLDPKDMAEKIGKVLTEAKTKSDLVEKGKDQAKKYSWLKMAKETLKVYQNVCT